MGKRKFSGLEITLIVLFCLVVVVAIILIALLATGVPAVKTTGKYFPFPGPESKPSVGTAQLCLLRCSQVPQHSCWNCLLASFKSDFSKNMNVQVGEKEE